MPSIEENPSRIVSALNPLVDRIPYSDGSFRRRLLAGLIVGLTAWVLSGHPVTELVTTDMFNQVYSHFFPAFAVGLAIYLLGTLIELIGNVSLVRTAAGLVHAASIRLNGDDLRSGPAVGARILVFGFCSNWLLLDVYAPQGVLDWIPDLPYNTAQALVMLLLGTALIGLPFEGLFRIVEMRSRKIPRVHKLLSAFSGVIAVPFRMAVEGARGFFGNCDYSLLLRQRISPEARSVLEDMPTRIKEGLDNPIGHHGDLALHHIVRLYGSPANRKWAKQLISRVRDVSAVVSALVVATTLVIGVGLFNQYETETGVFKPTYGTGLQAQTVLSELEKSRDLIADDVGNIRRSKLNGLTSYLLSDLENSLPRGSGAILQRELLFAFEQSVYRPQIFPGSRPSAEEEPPVDLDRLDELRVTTVAAMAKLRDAIAQQTIETLQKHVDQYQQNLRSFKAAIANETAAAQKQIAAAQRQRVIEITLAVLAWQVVLFLYVILFVTLRSTVESLVEALGIERLEQPRIVAVQSSEELAV